MSDVSPKIPRSVLRFLEERGITKQELFGRLQAVAPNDPHLTETALGSDDRLPWESFCDFSDAISFYFATDNDCDAYHAATLLKNQPWTPYLSLASHLFIGLDDIYAALLKLIGPSTFGGVLKSSLEKLEGRRFRVHLELAAGARPNPLLMRMCRAGFAKVPMVLQQPDALVDAVLTDRAGIYIITPPPSLSFLRRLRRAFFSIFAARHLLNELIEQDANLRLNYQRLLSTAAELKVARQLTESHADERTQELNVANRHLKERLDELLRKEEENRQLNLRIRHLQKVEALGTLASGLSHRINNVLHGIFLSLDLADRRIEAGHPAKEKVEMAMKFASTGQEIVRQVSAFNRHTQFQPQPVPLIEAIEEALQLVRQTLPPNISLQQEMPEDDFMPMILGGPTQIDRLLTNLSANAVYAMAEKGGRLTVSIRRASETDVILKVSDDGVGIAESDRQKIFEPFFTTKPMGQGTGMGLTVVYAIVQSMRGNIRAMAGPENRGTTIEIRLPLLDLSQLPGDLNEVFNLEIAGGQEKILVVEDEPDLLALLRDTLAAFGYEVATANSGQVALEMVRTQEFDLVLTDQMMPKMTGLELAHRIREFNRHVPIVLCTGFDDQISQLDESSVICSHVSKPLDAFRLNESIRSCLG